MSNERHFRSRILALTCGGVLAMALCSLVIPSAGNRPLAAFTFPQEVPLARWELTGTESLREQRKNVGNAFNVVQSGQRYHYLSNGLSLNAEVRYVARTTGEVSALLATQTAIPLEAFKQHELRHDKAIGFCSVFAHEDRAYLSVCINPCGWTTVTHDQFLANHRANDYTLQRAVLWLSGRESLRDYRCLWVNLSTPAQGEDLAVAYARLESTWTELSSWWQSHFPGY